MGLFVLTGAGGKRGGRGVKVNSKVWPVCWLCSCWRRWRRGGGSMDERREERGEICILIIDKGGGRHEWTPGAAADFS